MEKESPSSSDNEKSPKQEHLIEPSNLTIWQELKRRKVIRVAAVYMAVAWLVIQIAVSTFPYLLIPEWAISLIIMCVLLGFPISLVLAWAFELTPEGIRKTQSLNDQNSTNEISSKHDRKRNWLAYGVGADFPTVIFSIIAVFVIIFYDGSGSSRNGGTKSIAVLPFANLSSEPDQEYFAAGFQDGLITDLSKISVLRVISRRVNGVNMGGTGSDAGLPVALPAMIFSMPSSHTLSRSLKFSWLTRWLRVSSE